MRTKQVGNYEIGRTLGEGEFARVKYAIDVRTGKAVAIKVFRKETIEKNGMLEQIKKEISIMQLVRHPYIVDCIEALTSRTKVYLVLELCQGGELFEKLVSTGRFSEREARFYFHQLIEGVQYCHMQGISHRDLKPENLLLDKDGNLKISDFGLSAIRDGAASSFYTTCGTPSYCAPEVLVISKDGYDANKADIWSCGVILYVFLAGYMPFDGESLAVMFRQIRSAEYETPNWFSESAKDLISLMLQPDPTLRLTLDEIKKSVWYTTDVDNSQQKLPEPRQSFTESDLKIQLHKVDNLDEEEEKDHTLSGAISPQTAYSSDEEEKEDLEEPIVMTAFDVIAMVAGASISRMFSTNTSPTVKTYTTFTSTIEVPRILLEMSDILSKFESVTHRVYNGTFKIKMTVNPRMLDSPSSRSSDHLQQKRQMLGAKMEKIKATIQIYLLARDLKLVECKRTHGNVFGYYQFWVLFHEQLESRGLVTADSVSFS